VRAVAEVVRGEAASVAAFGLGDPVLHAVSTTTPAAAAVRTIVTHRIGPKLSAMPES
jgi:hypothetical protein